MHDEPQTLVCYPPGHMIVTLGAWNGDEGATGMRWSLMNVRSKKAMNKCVVEVELLQSAYPELKEGDYKVWKECLQKFFIPAGSDDL